MSAKKDSRQQSDDTSWWEWVAAAVGAALVLGLIGFLLFEAITEDATPPRIEVKATRVTGQQSVYLVELKVINRGGTTAAAVVVQGELRRDGETVETSEITLSYVPSASSRDGGLFFERDPRDYEMRLFAKGYESP